MAWERRGTIQVTNGSVNVVGTGTFFTSVTAGSGITIDGYIYAVETITDNTHITLSRAFVGTSGSGKSYEIFPTQSYAADVYAEVVDLLNTFGPFRGSVEDLNALILSKADGADASAASAAASAASALADKNTTATLKGDVITLKADVTTLKSDVTTLKDTATTQAGIATTKAGEAATSAASALSDKNATATLKSDVTTLKADVVTLKGDVTTLKDTATTQAGIATTKATEAASSAASALSDKNATATLKSDVITLKSDVTTLKDTATSQAGIATTKATEAASSASAAATSATNAATSKTNADDARDAALAAKTAAEAARDAALTAYDNFDDRMLGNKASDPTTDNDGNALVAGTLYFNTTANEMRLYTGSAWVAAYVSGGAYLMLSGGTMTGPLTLSGDPSTALQAATKQYADTKLALSGGTLTGSLTLSGAPTNSLHAATKAYVDGASITGNAATATKWAIGRTIALTGDITGTSGSFDGSANLSFATTLANSGVTAGTYGGNNSIPSVTIDAKGRVTSASTVTPSGTWAINVSGTAANITGTYGGTISSSQVTTGLGFTPVQQGTGVGQSTNTIKLGWSGTRLKATVDTTDQGNFVFDTQLNSGLALKADLAGATFTGVVNTPGGTHTGQVSFNGVTGNSVLGNSTSNLGALEIKGNGTGAAMIQFHRPGSFAAYIGVDTDNIWKVGGWSMGAASYKIYHEGAKPSKSDVGLGNVDNTADSAKSVNYANSAGSATLATKASTLAQSGGTGTAMTFNWSGQGGQPTWLWGGNDGTNHYVYNPSNFSVNYANSAGSATTAGRVVVGTLTGTNQANLVEATIADNDFFRIRVGGDATNSGWVELATADDGNEPIYVRQYGNAFTGSPARSAALLDSNGNTTFPQSVYSVNQYCSGIVSGTNGVYSSNWFRAYSATGYYNETYGRGLTVPDGTVSHGNVMCYGSGLSGWSGIAISSNNKTNWMTDGNTWGMYNAAGGIWMMNSDMSGNVTFNGNVTAYSDLRLKDNVREIDNIEARRDTLANSAIKYERDGRTRIGYGAQLLRDNGCSEFVHEADDARKLATGTGTLSVDYGETAAVLAVASKRTDDRVAALEAQVAALLQTVADLQNQLKGE